MGGEAYDKIAAFYAEDMGKNNSGEDIVYYTKACTAGPVLELGCGTGRITLPLARKGIRVVGIDRSPAMLAELRNDREWKRYGESGGVICCQMDMRSFAFRGKFPYIICPYSAFSYLLTAVDRKRMLENVRAHLQPGGEFIMDLFVPDPALHAFADDHLFHDYTRRLPDGSLLERRKTIVKDMARRRSTITRYYTFSATGRTITTRETIRWWYPSELAGFLQKAGFRVVQVTGDFSKQPCRPETRTAVFVCRVREA